MKNWGLRSRAILFSALPTLIACILLGLFFVQQRFTEIDSDLEQKGKLIASTYALAFAPPLQRQDLSALQSLGRNALEEHAVRSISVYDPPGNQLAHAGPLMKPLIGKLNLLKAGSENKESRLQFTAETLRILHPIFDSYQNTHEGWVEIELNLNDGMIAKYQSGLLALGAIFVALLLNAVVAFRFSKDIGDAIRKIMGAIHQMQSGELETHIEEDSYGELKELQHALNSLSHSIVEGQRELQQNVDQATEDLRETLETIEIQNIELDLARKEALEASRIKSEFLANMSHEIRTPLNGVIGFTNLLLKSALNATQKDYLETIQKSSESLLAIINDILDFSKIEAGKLVLDQVPVNLQETVEDVLTMLAPMAYEKRLEQVSLFYSDVPPNVIGDPLRLKQILTNLINNAIKFTEHGEVIVRVMLDDVKESNATIKITVSDTGIGLNKEQQESLFNAFRQADTTTARRFGGTGLGLVISKHLVEQMRGQIGLESEKGRGSTFWFTFKAEIHNTDESPIALLADKVCKVALYDANPTVRLALKNTLQKRLIDTIEYSVLNQLQALFTETFELNRPDAIIIGINSQQPMYLEISKLIKQNNHQFPIIILGNHSDQMVLADMLKDEPPPLIAKPLNQRKTFDTLKRIICHDDDAPTAIKALSSGDAETKAQWEAPLGVEHKETPSSGYKSPPLQVVAVDDNAANLKLLTALLEDLGVAVTPCDSGPKCLELVDRLKYDLVLMDIQMPGMDGLETTRRIRMGEHNDQHTPIVAVTAHALASEKKQLLKSGMDDYVTKPINETQLIHIIKRWTGIDLKQSRPADATAQAMGNAAVDIRLGIKLANGKEDLAEEMLGMLFDSLIIDRKTIKEKLAIRDYDAALDAVHKLHGATRYTGVPRLQQVARSVEENLKTKQYGNVEALCGNLLAEIDAVLKWGEQHRGLVLEHSSAPT